MELIRRTCKNNEFHDLTALAHERSKNVKKKVMKCDQIRKNEC